MQVSEKVLGKRAAFLLPSLKLKSPSEPGVTFEQDVHRFLTSTFEGYTAAAGNLFGYWKDAAGNDSYGEHRQFTVALLDESKLPALKEYLACLARQMHEDCIYLETGDSASLIFSDRSQSRD